MTQNISHKWYFAKYKLNVAQYGEILIAEVFHGEKRGDSQVNYDILVSKENFIEVLEGLTKIKNTSKFSKENDCQIRIQVKSKLAITATGKASVVHCSKAKSRAEEMTHLAVVIVNPGDRIINGDPSKEGNIEEAWLLSKEQAFKLRKKPGKQQYIAVNQLRKEDNIINLTDCLSQIANKNIDL